MSTKLHNQRSRRDGVTLIELMLVLGLIVVATSLAMPMLIGSMRMQQLRSAADQLRADLAQARNRAMSAGQTLGLVYSETTYTIGPAGDLIDENEGNLATPIVQKIQTLPDGIMISGMASQGTSRDQAASPAGGTTAPSSGDVFAYFYPDGTTSTVEFELFNDKKEKLIVSLRGITGVALVQNAPSQNEGIVVAEFPDGKGGTTP